MTENEANRFDKKSQSGLLLIREFVRKLHEVAREALLYMRGKDYLICKGTSTLFVHEDIRI